ncbi:NCS2 family permease [Companilactobacillus furfuricola]|uniref:NCS2 family permease n=1 Tax=Companilactobacillus furfuricola TaxID=1462575 RepID=UPI000F7979EC|nr:NCS2 family permease [Companilactobacillus furfuricola]
MFNYLGWNKLTKSDIKTEIIAGITGFFTISYIIIVNPMILKDASIPVELSVFATIFASIIGCLLMAFWANAPIIITPGMGVNAFFTYTLVVGMQLSFQQAIAISIFSSVVYMLISFSKLSDLLAAAVPSSLKIGITTGIGMFLVVIGLQKAGLIKQGANGSLLSLGNLSDPAVLLALFGLLVTLGLFIKRIPGSFIIGIVLTSVMAFFFGITTKTPQTDISMLSKYGELLFQGDFSELFSLKFLLAVFSMTMILVFESMGILEGLLPDKKLFKKAFQASSVATFLSGFLGTSPTVAAAESAAGIKSGGKTGIMSLTSGILFAVALPFISFLRFVPEAAIAPVIIITGALMMQNLANIDYDDLSEWIPAFLIFVLIPLSGSISAGMAFGFIVYPVLKMVVGDHSEMSLLLVVISVLFLVQIFAEALFVG